MFYYGEHMHPSLTFTGLIRLFKATQGLKYFPVSNALAYSVRANILLKLLILNFPLVIAWRYNTQYNDTQNNDTQHNGT